MNRTKNCDDELVLTLIEKELQDAKLLNEMERIGFDSSILAANLCVAILSLIGFPKELVDITWYYEMLNSHISEIDLRDEDTIEEAVIHFFEDLKLRWDQYKSR